jgi:hypothetical protein
MKEWVTLSRREVQRSQVLQQVALAGRQRCSIAEVLKISPCRGRAELCPRSVKTCFIRDLRIRMHSFPEMSVWGVIAGDSPDLVHQRVQI